MDFEKAKQALASFEQEKQKQNNRLILAAQAKQQLDNINNRINTLHP